MEIVQQSEIESADKIKEMLKEDAVFENFEDEDISYSNDESFAYSENTEKEYENLLFNVTTLHSTALF